MDAASFRNNLESRKQDSALTRYWFDDMLLVVVYKNGHEIAHTVIGWN